MTTDEPDYIVYRFSPDMPEEWRPPQMDGWWVDRNTVPEYSTLQEKRGARDPEPGECVAIATGRFETREDGRIAEVFEIRPLWKIDLRED